MKISEVLRPEHREAGLYLEEDDHTVSLKRGNQVLARWSATGASKDSILSIADKYIH
jgi:hypothetical protein